MDNKLIKLTRTFIRLITCILILVIFKISVNANNISYIDYISETREEYFGYYPYGIAQDGTPMFENKYVIREWVKSGILTEK